MRNLEKIAQRKNVEREILYKKAPLYFFSQINRFRAKRAQSIVPKFSSPVSRLRESSDISVPRAHQKCSNSSKNEYFLMNKAAFDSSGRLLSK